MSHHYMSNKITVTVSITMSKDFTIKPGGNLKDAVRHQVVLPSEAHSIIGMLRKGTQAEYNSLTVKDNATLYIIEE